MGSASSKDGKPEVGQRNAPATADGQAAPAGKKSEAAKSSTHVPQVSATAVAPMLRPLKQLQAPYTCLMVLMVMMRAEGTDAKYMRQGLFVGKTVNR